MLFVLTGPESTAKSALTIALAEHFKLPAVSEVARDYLTSSTTGTSYLPSDLLAIARRQMSAESGLKSSAFADTDLQVVYLWWQQRFGPVPDFLAAAYAGQSTRYYLLCEPDIAWQADPLRENPHDREQLFALYEADLRARGLRYSRISGQGDERIICAQRAVLSVDSALEVS